MPVTPLAVKEMSPRVKARIAGFLYLIVIVGGIFAEIFVRGRLVVSGDAAATAHNILTHPLLFRMGFAVEVFYCACNIPLGLIFYELFKVVNKKVALLMVFFSLVGTAIESVSLLAHVSPVIILGGAQALNAFTAEQLQGAAYMSLQLFEYGFAIALVFFGFFCLSLAYAIFKSTFFPRIIGALLAVEGLLYLITSFAKFISAAVAARVFPLLAVSGLAEVSICLWLLVMGVNAEKWREQAIPR
jgi:hypothetical protein